MGGACHKLEWVRIAGNMISILAGAAPVALGVLRNMWQGHVFPPV
jgi:hypothetical protein